MLGSGLGLGLNKRINIQNGFVGAFDDYEADIYEVFSLRRVLASYTGPLIRIRNSATTTETDIGYDSDGNLDTAAILAHGATNTITTLYGQKGSFNAVQTTAANQPRISSGGVIDTENGKPCINFTATSSHFLANSLAGLARLDSFIVRQSSRTTELMFDGLAGYPGGPAGNEYSFISQSGNTSTLLSSNYGTPSLYKNGNLFSGTTRADVYTFLQTGAQILEAHINASTSFWGAFDIGYYNASIGFNGTAQEFLFFNNDQSANRSEIEAGINSYYSIY